MKPTNRGQVEVQFNWIFILIVGAIILGFFVSIAVKQSQSSQQEIKTTFFINFEQALTGISAVEGKQLLFEIPSLDVRYDCTAECDCAAYAGESRAKSQVTPFSMNDKIIFSPNSLKGNNLLTWSKDWAFPFTITNFLFMTSPEAKYLIEDTGRGDDIYDNLPPLTILKEQRQQKAFDKELFDPNKPITAEQIKGNYKVKFIMTESDPPTILPKELRDLPNSDVTAIKIIKATTQSPEEVKFYQKNNAGAFAEIGTSYLFGDATVYASIFAEDENAYTCMMNRAMKRLITVSSIYKEKQEQYAAYFTNPQLRQDCGVYYVSTPISQLVTTAQTFDFKSPDQDANTIIQDARSFTTQNDNALRDSCPHLY